VGKSEILEAIQLKIGDKLIKHELPILDSGKKANFNAYAQGFKSADGMDDYNRLYLYEPKYMCAERLEYYKKCEGDRTSLIINAPLPKNYVPFDLGLKDQLNWLAGLLDGDGCELKEGGAQLASVNFTFLINLQNLLASIGIQSKVISAMPEGFRKLPDGLGGHKDYWCKESKRICIGAVQIQDLKNLGLKCERLRFDKTPQRDASQFSKVISIEELENTETVYCFNEPKRHLALFNGVITGQCAEIMLRENSFCNLSEVIIRPNDDLDSLLEKVETATWIGVIQSSFDNFPYLRKEWKKNCEDERLLGVSLTGQMDNPKVLTEESLKTLKSRAIKIAKKASEKMNLSTPAAITCVKPSGTVSQLVNCGSGLHPWYSEYFIRRYRISSIDPLFKMIKDQGVELSPEVGQTEKNANTWVISFPMKAPRGAVIKDAMSALDQLEHYKKVQTNWCEHNASSTIYVKDQDWMEVGSWIYENWDVVKGLSFLPYSGGYYEQAPLEAITKEQYEKLLEKMPKIDYSKLTEYEKEDNTDGAKTLACVGDKCEI
jgi:ribonucleotide reductase, class II